MGSRRVQTWLTTTRTLPLWLPQLSLAYRGFAEKLESVDASRPLVLSFTLQSSFGNPWRGDLFCCSTREVSHTGLPVKYLFFSAAPLAQVSYMQKKEKTRKAVVLVSDTEHAPLHFLAGICAKYAWGPISNNLASFSMTSFLLASK